ncbi:cyclin-dependent kinases regulatory subunit-like [Glossina fuscipes]|uniref:Cyclin-dependent kinases regulatory subunit n=1 Tax=Glossina fuscipes TaxID=7396 RepID=A0A9C5Z040_9MUSC|nr:cyclin-dependent kinases regulatory subunit-like [Glossina fuscipes]
MFAGLHAAWPQLALLGCNAGSDMINTKRALVNVSENIYYSAKYEYRHVFLPKELLNRMPRTHLMSETQWRSIGVQQSRGWIHYMIHYPEPHILLFRRPIQQQ